MTKDQDKTDIEDKENIVIKFMMTEEDKEEINIRIRKDKEETIIKTEEHVIKAEGFGIKTE